MMRHDERKKMNLAYCAMLGDGRRLQQDKAQIGQKGLRRKDIGGDVVLFFEGHKVAEN